MGVYTLETLPAVWETWVRSPVSGGFPGMGRGDPLWCSCLENSMDRGAWWATVKEVAESWTRLSYWTTITRLATAFLPRTKCLLISWLQSPSAVILESKKIKSLTVSTVSPSICHEVMGPDALILVFWMLSFKPTFSLSSFHFHQGVLYFVDMDKMILNFIWRGERARADNMIWKKNKDRELMTPNFKTHHKIP